MTYSTSYCHLTTFGSMECNKDVCMVYWGSEQYTYLYEDSGVVKYENCL
jgi:hypothetical protein